MFVHSCSLGVSGMSSRLVSEPKKPSIEAGTDCDAESDNDSNMEEFLQGVSKFDTFTQLDNIHAPGKTKLSVKSEIEYGCDIVKNLGTGTSEEWCRTASAPTSNSTKRQSSPAFEDHDSSSTICVSPSVNAASTFGPSSDPAAYYSRLSTS